MKDLFFSKQAKIIVDVLLLIGLILLLSVGHIGPTSGDYWNSAHCIIGSALFLLMAVHVIQHWRFIKAFTKKKVILKNKVTTVTILLSALILTSILTLTIIGTPSLKFHNVIGHIFIFIAIIHVIDKAKRFLSLFRG